MEGNRKRIIAVLSIFILIFGYSLYDFINKNTIKEEPPPIAVTVGGGKAVKEEPVIYVSGAVNKPGVFKIAPESRVIDAVNVAGGFSARADSEKINLAQQIKDGQHIHVPFKTQPSDTKERVSAAEYSDRLININEATERELQELPGIGPALARRIVDYRTRNGPFEELSELRRVAGIGEMRFSQLEPLISL
jgi:competence protein ComEA